MRSYGRISDYARRPLSFILQPSCGTLVYPASILTQMPCVTVYEYCGKRFFAGIYGITSLYVINCKLLESVVSAHLKETRQVFPNQQRFVHLALPLC